MAINFSGDILPFFATNVVTETAYQAGGTYSLPAFFGALTLATAGITAANAGSSYLALDVVTLSGGALYSGGAAATVTILAVDGGGAATSVALKTTGHYKTVPTNGISTTGGAGTGLKIDGTWTGYAAQRILTFTEIVRTYMAQIDNNHEAKLLQEVLGRITASIRVGTPTWDTTHMPANAQKNALEFIAHHIFATDI